MRICLAMEMFYDAKRMPCVLHLGGEMIYGFWIVLVHITFVMYESTLVFTRNQMVQF